MRRKLTVAAAFALVVLTGAATYAWAAQATTPTQTINACIAPDGKFQLAPDARTCKKGEQALSWNTVGPPGDTGATGATGASGPQGARGPAGESAGNPDAITATVLAHGKASGNFSQTPIDVTAISHEIVSPATLRPGFRPGSDSTSRSRSRCRGAHRRRGSSTRWSPTRSSTRSRSPS